MKSALSLCCGIGLCCLANANQVDLTRLPLAFEPAPNGSAYLARGAGSSVSVRSDGAVFTAKASPKSAPQRLEFKGASAGIEGRPSGMLPGKVNYFLGSDPKSWRSSIATFEKIEYRGVYPGTDVVFYGNGSHLEYDFVLSPGADPTRIRLRFSGASRPSVAHDGSLVAGQLRQHAPTAFQMNGPVRTEVACRYILRANGEVGLETGSYDHTRSLVIDPVLTYGTYVGGSVNDGVTSLKVDSLGNILIAGFTSSSNFPVRGAVQSAYAGTTSPIYQGQFGDAFVAKLNASGTAMLWSTYLGGHGDDFATGVAMDPTGNVYITGNTQSADFPVTAGVIQRTYKGFTMDDNNGFYNPGDGFVAKLNASGNQLLYATYLGGSLNDLALGIAADTNGNAVVVGATESSDFPTTTGALASRFRGNSGAGPSVAGDGFVSVLNPAGTALLYSTFLGGAGRDGAAAVALDAQNNIFVCGFTSSSDFPVTAGAAQSVLKSVPVTSNGFTTVPGNAFVTKLSAQGALLYSTYLGGSKGDAATAIAVDSAGAAYVTGATISPNFPTTAGAPQSAYKGSGAVGTIGDAYGGDAFVTKVNAAGTAFAYSTYLGGAGDEAGLGIAVDATGSAFVTGFSLSRDFPVSSDALQKSNAGFGGQGLAPNASQGFPTERVRNTGDAFVVKLSPAGSLTYSSFYGGSADDAGLSIALDAAGNPYIGGNTLSTSFAGSSGSFQPAYAGSGPQWPRGDGFVARFDFGGTVSATPARISVTSGFSGTGAPGSALTSPFKVQVLDSNGGPVAKVTVTFSATGATVNPTTAITDSQGQASTVVTLGAAGTGSVTASVAGIPVATVPLTISTAGVGPVVKALTNGASFQAPVAAGSWISVFVDRTADALAGATKVPLPISLGGFRVLVNGTPIPIVVVVPLSPAGTQINAQLPYEIPTGTAQVVVEQNGVSSAPFSFTVLQSAPGIFVFGSNRAVVQNVAPDGSVSVNTETNPVPAGDYIIAYLTGQGPLDNPVATGDVAGSDPLSKPLLPYSATLGGRPVNVSFLGMTPGQIALAQANIQVPRDLLPGTYPLVITIGSGTSNGPMITVTNPRP